MGGKKLKMAYRILWNLLLRGCLVLVVVSCQSTLPPSEYAALQSLYNSTQGENWAWVEPYDENGFPWNFSNPLSDPCNDFWQGVGCEPLTTSLNTVNIISLPQMNIDGSLPSAFFNLPNLVYINLDGNWLTSTIPKSFFSLENLFYVDFGSNQLIGTVSDDVAFLSQLQIFSLNSNQFEGTIPSAFANLTLLSYFDLGKNELTGTIPASVLAKLTSLSYLDLSNNELIGTIPASAFAQLSLLSYLDLSSNKLAGTVPPALYSSASMNLLSLADNSLHGSIPHTINLPNIVVLNLAQNDFAGSLPPQIGNLTSLQELTLSQNAFTGSLPSTIGALQSLVIINLNNNGLTGTLPNALMTLTQVRVLNLFDNQLSGTIPSAIGNMSSLVYLYLGYNLFDGSIPSTIEQLSAIEIFSIVRCHLTGSLPPVLQNMTSLKYLELSRNELTGTVPPLGSLVKMQLLLLDQNRLHGTFPADVVNLVRLAIFVIGDNLFSGHLSEKVWNLEPLAFVNIELNFLESFFPPNINVLQTLQWLVVSKNFMHGTIPHTFGNLTRLQLVDMQYNKFEGTLPSSLGTLPALEYFSVTSNQFFGTIPATFVHLPMLQTLSLSQNQFSGLLPAGFNEITTLDLLDLSSNGFHGNLIDQFASLTSVTILDIAANQYTGDLVSFFKSLTGRNTSLSVLDVSNNRITGALPDLATWSRNITNFAAGVNYINNMDIPASYCTLPKLNTLLLDGMNSKAHSEASAGTIPACLFSMPSLKKLHLAGNKFQGSLPSTLSLPAGKTLALTELVLSFNILSGAIPSWIWQHPQWAYLDLSFNRFSGYIPSNAVVTMSPESMTLSLEQNHLSGDIPLAFKEIANVDVLNGNIFTCDLNGNTLPSNDPYVNSYVCGSDNANGGLIAWVCFVGGTFVSVLLLHVWHLYGKGRMASLQQVLRDFWHTILTLVGPVHSKMAETNPLILHFESSMNQILYVLVFPVMVVPLVIYMPLYGIFTVFYGVYQSQYLWTLSACYLHGIVPTVILLLVSIIALYGLKQCLAAVALDMDMIHHYLHLTRHPKALLVLIAQYLTMAMVVVTVIAANMGYIYALTSNISVNGMTMITILLSVFKVVSGLFVIHGLPALGSSILHLIHRTPSSVPQERVVFGVTATTFLMVTNNVIVPYLADMLINPSCFYYLLTSPPLVTSKYTLTLNKTVFLPWYNEVYSMAFPPLIQDSTFRAPFAYSYVCSSTLMTSFVYVFLVRYIISSVILPVVYLSLEALSARYYVRPAATMVPLPAAGSLSSTTMDHRGSTKRLRPTWEETRSAWLLRITPYRLRPIQWYVDLHRFETVMDNPSGEPSMTSRTTSITEMNAPPALMSVAPSQEVINPMVAGTATASDPIDTASIDPTDAKATTKTHTRTPSVASRASRLSSATVGRARSVVANLSKRVSRLPPSPSTFELRKLIPSRKEIVVKLVSDLAVMLTYGIQFPLLNVVIAVAWLVESRMLYFVYFRRVQAMVQRCPSLLSRQLNEMAMDLGQFEGTMQKAFVPLPYLAAIFLSYTLFDTLGASVGAVSALWVLFVMSLAPAYCYAVDYLWVWFRARWYPTTTDDSGNNGSKVSSSGQAQNPSSGRSASIAIEMLDIVRKPSADTADIEQPPQSPSEASNKSSLKRQVHDHDDGRREDGNSYDV